MGPMKLNKVTVRRIAKDALAEGRVMDAVLILTDCYEGKRHYSLDSALVEIACEPTATVGDILYTSWGYDQTNVDFYRVTRVKGKTVYVREIGATRVDDSHVTATAHTMSATETRHTIQKHYTGVGYVLNIDGYTAWIWDGKPQYVTPSGYGH